MIEKRKSPSTGKKNSQMSLIQPCPKPKEDLML